MPDIDTRRLSLAYLEAMYSPDPSNQNGAVITNLHGIVATGWNGFPAGFECDPSDRDLKMRRIEHAERAAIFNLIGVRVQPLPLIMFCPWAPCYECARAIALAIDTLVVHKERTDLTPERWKANVDGALECLSKTTEIIFHEGPVDAYPVIVNGEMWSPRECEFV